MILGLLPEWMKRLVGSPFCSLESLWCFLLPIESSVSVSIQKKCQTMPLSVTLIEHLKNHCVWLCGGFGVPVLFIACELYLFVDL